MFCEKCGSKMNDDSKVCTKCGWQLSGNSDENSNEKLNGELTQELKNVVPGKKKHGMAIAVVLIVILLLGLGIGIAIPLILSSNGSHDEKKEIKDNNDEGRYLYEDSYSNEDIYYDEDSYSNKDSYSDEGNYSDEDSYLNEDSYSDEDSYSNEGKLEQSDSEGSYAYNSENDFYSEILGVSFTNTENDLINWANSNGMQYRYNQRKDVLYCAVQDSLNQVIDNSLEAAGEEFLKEHEFGVGDIKNIYDGMTDESNQGLLDSIVGGVAGYLGGVIQEKVDNAIDSGVKEGIKTASSDNNIYYSFGLDGNRQVNLYCITELLNNRESLYDTFVQKFGTPVINENVYIWYGQVSGTPATLKMWIDVNSSNNYVWKIFVVKNA